ncbi:MAG: glutamate--tRNA ligase [Thermoplasmata archaeon]|nr:glutamate--tRNA ligase [Thermoplasmata archaeon]
MQSREEDDITNIARKYALQNAIQHDGKAVAKSVIGKILAEKNELRSKVKIVYQIVEEVTQEINQLSINEQRKMLEEIAPELLIKEKKERDFSLPPLPHAEKGKVVTRFPPEPNGYLHIGHAKAAIIDYEYARMYDGRFILRFDDTNPENEELRFYQVQREDLQWLGLEWDEEYNTSDNIEKHYKLALKLIEQEDAYVCTCKPDSIKENRFRGIACSCRSRSKDENKELWREMQYNLAPGSAILRLKGDMKSTNTAMRDPTLFRIIDTEHPIQGDKYRVWPTYDFAGAIEDSLSGVTHPFRTKEYELRDEVYFYILERLNLRKPHLMEFSRLAIEGMPVSKRLIKPLIERGQVHGYDDVRLPTLRGLRRRGILKETLRQFVLSQGISKVESRVTFDQIEAINRKLIDPIAKRFFFVPNPVKMIVKNAPHMEKTLKLHPTEDLGYRKIKVGDVFYISKEDAEKLKKSRVIRLKDLYNVQIEEKDDVIISKFAGKELKPEYDKIQWVAEEGLDMLIYKPDLLFKNGEFNKDSLKEIRGLVEKSIESINEGEIVQFERFGFVKIENKEKLVGIFIHK